MEAVRVQRREELNALYDDDSRSALRRSRHAKAGMGASPHAFSVDGYGFDRWRTLFTDRQLLTLATLVRECRGLAEDLPDYPEPWREALIAYSGCILSKFADYSSAICSWHNSAGKS